MKIYFLILLGIIVASKEKSPPIIKKLSEYCAKTCNQKKGSSQGDQEKHYCTRNGILTKCSYGEEFNIATKDFCNYCFFNENKKKMEFFLLELSLSVEGGYNFSSCLFSTIKFFVTLIKKGKARKWSTVYTQHDKSYKDFMGWTDIKKFSKLGAKSLQDKDYYLPVKIEKNNKDLDVDKVFIEGIDFNLYLVSTIEEILNSSIIDKKEKELIDFIKNYVDEEKKGNNDLPKKEDNGLLPKPGKVEDELSKKVKEALPGSDGKIFPGNPIIPPKDEKKSDQKINPERKNLEIDNSLNNPAIKDSKVIPEKPTDDRTKPTTKNPDYSEEKDIPQNKSDKDKKKIIPNDANIPENKIFEFKPNQGDVKKPENPTIKEETPKNEESRKKNDKPKNQLSLSPDFSGVDNEIIKSVKSNKNIIKDINIDIPQSYPSPEYTPKLNLK